MKQYAFTEDAGSAWYLTSSDDVVFDDGWYPLELEKGVHTEGWRWMGRSALTRLRSHDRTMRLRVTGWVPLDLIGSAPSVTMRWNGVRLDGFIAPPGRFTREFLITPEMQMQRGDAWGDFLIETSATGNARGDLRDLGYSIAELRWEPAPP